MDKNTDSKGQELTDAQAKAFIASVTPDMVRSVYSGRIGCMCGCKGKHRYNPKHQVEASADRGYPVTDEDVSIRSVKNILKKVMGFDSTQVQDGYILHTQVDGRQYAVYLCKSSAI